MVIGFDVEINDPFKKKFEKIKLAFYVNVLWFTGAAILLLSYNYKRSGTLLHKVTLWYSILFRHIAQICDFHNPHPLLNAWCKSACAQCPSYYRSIKIYAHKIMQQFITSLYLYTLFCFWNFHYTNKLQNFIKIKCYLKLIVSASTHYLNKQTNIFSNGK